MKTKISTLVMGTGVMIITLLTFVPQQSNAGKPGNSSKGTLYGNSAGTKYCCKAGTNSCSAAAC